MSSFLEAVSGRSYSNDNILVEAPPEPVVDLVPPDEGLEPVVDPDVPPGAPAPPVPVDNMAAPINPFVDVLRSGYWGAFRLISLDIGTNVHIATKVVNIACGKVGF